MTKYLTPLLFTAAVALTGCNKKDDEAAAPPNENTDAAKQSSAVNSNLPAPVIAVIDVKLLDQAQATAEIRKEIDAKRNEFQAEMTKYEKELRDKDQKLAKDAEKLSPEELKKRKADFEKVVADVQMKLNIRKLQLETAFEEARQKVYTAFLQATDSVRLNMGVNLVLYKEQIGVADNSFDITNQVLSKLNKDLPNVKITYKSETEILELIKSQS